uniref:AIG1-type G domain-containing protein n=1 Tax=Cyprinus carpio TaxID=7962 RepID=A0A8C2C6X4_CYPCA
ALRGGMEIIQETFGENSLKYTMVLFTRGDDLNDKTIEQYLGKTVSALKQLIDVCENRYHDCAAGNTILGRKVFKAETSRVCHYSVS